MLILMMTITKISGYVNDDSEKKKSSTFCFFNLLGV